jgi:hypothetical protein
MRDIVSFSHPCFASMRECHLSRLLSVPQEAPLLTEAELDATTVPPVGFYICSLLARVKLPRLICRLREVHGRVPLQ